MITHISFDLDGTLITRDCDHHLWNDWIPRECARTHCLPLDLARAHAFGEYYAAQYVEQIPNWTSIDYWLKRLSIYNDGRYWELDTLVTLFDDVIPALDALASDHKLILCTANDGALLQCKLDATGISPYFAHIVSVPTDYGTWKKTSATYQRLLNDLHLQAHQVLHIGNNTHQDHDSPKAAGMHALLLDRNGEKAGSIRTLSEVAAFVAAKRGPTLPCPNATRASA